jgi:DNA (cytosine-5)-methyltransferase 1
MTIEVTMHRITVNPFYAARIKRRPAAVQVLDLFSGIGGSSLGFERAGMKTAAFCDNDPYCQTILAKHWPRVPIYDDIKQLNHRRLHHDGINHIDIICGGYPCQPFSIAGRRRGEKDPRHLWPEMHRLIREIRPRWVVCENVDGHVERGLDTVLADLENAGYACWTFVVPACAVGAPHRRDRVWVVAHAARIRRKEPAGSGLSNTQELPAATIWRELPSPFTCRSDDGIPFLMERLQALGNAVVPQIPEMIGRAITAFERDSQIGTRHFKMA